MTLCFLDLNVWLALSDHFHIHHREAWTWMSCLPGDAQLAFSRYTQIGLLRLLANASVMGDAVLTLGEAWRLYEEWLADPRVVFYPEPREVEIAFRRAAATFETQSAPKVVGDCWLIAFARGTGATLVTFDRALYELCRKQGQAAVIPA